MKCTQCNNDCPGDCESCLEAIHFNKTNRRYDCPNLVYYYVCKYIHKYSSEIDHLFASLKSLRTFTEYSVISIGCGPCTELAGLYNYLSRTSSGRPVSYVGFELNYLWQPVHNEIDAVLANSPFPVTTRFIYGDAIKLVRRLNKDQIEWRPNLLILQYVISDLVKSRASVPAFLDSLHEQVVRFMPENSYIIFNDINHFSASDNFERFERIISREYETWVHRAHYKNPWKKTAQYGVERSSNLLTSSIPPAIMSAYNPWTRCTSAQMVIKKLGSK
jgi:hypothetical protein